MAEYRMAILNDYQDVATDLAAWDRIADRVQVEAIREHHADRDELVERLAPYDILFAMRERTSIDRTLIERLPNLKLIVTAGPLNAAIDVVAAQDHGIVVSGTHYTNHATVEMVWALILSLTRGVPDEVQSVRNGGWQVGVGQELFGKTLGIIGLGGIGGAVSRIAQAFGMKVVAWSQNLTQAAAQAAGATYLSKDALLASADIVTIHLRLSERTRGLIGAAELAMMKPHAMLVNTSRGPIVDEDALVAALRERRIAGAAIDVYEVEPLAPDHPFRALDRLLPTPHIGYVSRQLYTLFFGQALENVEAWLAGAPIRAVPDFNSIGTSGLPEWITGPG